MENYNKDITLVDRVLALIKSDSELIICDSIQLDSNLILIVSNRCQSQCVYCEMFSSYYTINKNNPS